MDLDNIKDMWQKDSQDLPEVSIIQQKKIFSPLEMIRANMITEVLLVTLFFIYCYLDFPFSEDFNTEAISGLEMFLSVGLIVYFYSRFIKLYKILSIKNYNTNYDLFNLKTQLLIAKEVYVSYYISTIAITSLYLLMIIDFNFSDKYHAAIFSAMLIAEIILVFFNIKYWIYYMYGQYIDVVVDTVDELNGIEVKENIVSQKNWFKKTHSYLFQKYGMKGHVINTVLWFVVGYSTLFILLAITLIIIISLAWKFDIIDIRLFKDALKGIGKF